ncbi:hypothetical protein X777_09514 [Ooceraea biroi]|nr:hypothetical protein X777_09514 [Ooceraea biroi]
MWCLSYLYLKTHAEHSLQHSEELSDGSQCTFDASQKTYNVTDLMGCMNELMTNLFAQTNGRSLKQPSQSDLLTHEKNSYQFPYEDIIANLFNNGASSIYQNLPLDSLANNYQNFPNAPNELFGQFGDFRVNLFNALSSISRNDDLKCVPRILCEIASGNPPGEYKQTSTGNNKQYGILGDFGRNAFIQWLARFDIAETSPLLSFARAATLGYSSRGNPAMCYRSFPRCPRNPDKLVHYLNNHNGGFFRFFNRNGHGSYPQPYALQGNSRFVRGRRRKALPPGIAGAEADRTGTGELKFDIPVLITRQDYGRSFFPKENILESSGQVVFPDHEKANDHPSENRIPKTLSDLRDSDANIFSRDSPPFFSRAIFV